MTEPCTVLVVEDDASNAKLLTIVMSDAGYLVRVAPSAEDALEALAFFRPRVILLDIGLPVLSGLMLATRIRSDPAFATTLIVAVSAFSGPEVERMALAAGCAAFIRKPFDALALPAQVATMLEAA